jgi:hypothetical protein
VIPAPSVDAGTAPLPRPLLLAFLIVTTSLLAGFALSIPFWLLGLWLAPQLAIFALILFLALRSAKSPSRSDRATSVANRSADDR